MRQVTEPQMRFGLTRETIAEIHAVLAGFPSIDRAILYGSRAKGTYEPGSDIDLCLEGAKLTTSDLISVISALDNTLLPYSFDLSLKHHLNELPLIEHIERVGQLFYER